MTVYFAGVEDIHFTPISTPGIETVGNFRSDWVRCSLHTSYNSGSTNEHYYRVEETFGAVSAASWQTFRVQQTTSTVGYPALFRWTVADVPVLALCARAGVVPKLYSVNGGTYTLLATGTGAMPPVGTLCRLDIKMDLFLGSCLVYIDKALSINFSGDLTQVSSYTEITGLELGGGADDVYFSEVAWCSIDTRRIKGVGALPPVADGFATDWIGSAVDVNEVILDENTSNTTSTSGDVQEYTTRTFSEPDGSLVYAVIVGGRVRGSNALLIRTGNTDYLSPDYTPTTPTNEMYIWQTNPNTGIEFKVEEINDPDFNIGVESRGGFSVGAVNIDGSIRLWNWPTMLDSPTGSMSLWMYNDDPEISGWNMNGPNDEGVVLGSVIYDPANGGAAFGTFCIGRTPSASTQLLVASIARGNPTVITLTSNPIGIIKVGMHVALFADQTGWNSAIIDNVATAVSSSTVTVDFDSSGLPAYNPSLNLGEHQLQIYGDATIIDITRATNAIVTFTGEHHIAVGSKVISLFINQDFSLFNGWPSALPHGGEYLVVSATPKTITLDADTSGVANPYDPGSVDNRLAFFQIENAFTFYLYDGTDGPSIEELAPQYKNHVPYAEYVNVLVSWDTNHAAGTKVFEVYYNDDLQFRGDMHDLGVGFDVKWSADATNFGDPPPTMPPSDSNPGAGFWLLFGGLLSYVAEFWLDTQNYIDFSDPDNRAKFHDGSGAPIFLGTQGELPTGTPPTIYCHIDAVPGDPYTTFASEINGLRVVNNNRDGGSALSPLDLSGGSTTALTCSFWIFGGFQGDILVPDGLEIFVEGEKVNVYLRDSLGNAFNFEFTIPYVDLVNVRFAVDTNHGVGSKIVNAYYNNSTASVTVTQDDVSNLSINWDNAYSPSGDGFICEVWADNNYFDPESYFIDGSGNPVNLGTNGELVTGNSPLLYFTVKSAEDADQILVNRGVGGVFTPFGGVHPPQLMPEASDFLVNRASPTNQNLRLNLGWQTFDMAPVPIASGGGGGGDTTLYKLIGVVIIEAARERCPVGMAEYTETIGLIDGYLLKGALPGFATLRSQLIDKEQVRYRITNSQKEEVGEGWFDWPGNILNRTRFIVPTSGIDWKLGRKLLHIIEDYDDDVCLGATINPDSPLSIGIAEYTTTEGTAPYQLLGPVREFFTLMGRIPDGTVVKYRATNVAKEEYGEGTFDAGSNTLIRHVPTIPSTLVSWGPGRKLIYINEK